MACVGCQKRREMIARMARTIVFGGRRRKLARFSEDDGQKGDPAGMDQSAAGAGALAAAAAGTDNHAGAAGESAAAGASTGGGG